jgi:hypothetical protein
MMKYTPSEIQSAEGKNPDAVLNAQEKKPAR